MLLALVLVFSLIPGVVIAEGEEHVHCLCGANTVKNTVCEECDSEAKVWTGVNKLPTTSGYYYLTESISDEKAVVNGTHVNLCLHGKTVTSKTGIKLAYVAGGGSLKLTDCSEEPGTLTGVTKEPVVQVANNSTFSMYGGKITGNTASSIDGVVRLDYGTTAVNGGTFVMYGGEISGNTVKRGTIYAALKNGVKPCVTRILGGTITSQGAVDISATNDAILEATGKTSNAGLIAKASATANNVHMHSSCFVCFSLNHCMPYIVKS